MRTTMQYHERNTIHMCLVKQKNFISLMGILVLYRRDPIPDSVTPSDARQRSSRQSIHIGHALGSGFVQSIFSPPPRRPPFECFPSVSRRDAELKILCTMERFP